MEVKFSSIACTLFLVLGFFHLCEAEPSKAEEKCFDDLTTIAQDLIEHAVRVERATPSELYKSKCTKFKNKLDTCRDKWTDAMNQVGFAGVYHELCLTEHAEEYMNMNDTKNGCIKEIKSVTVTLDSEYLKEKDGNRTAYKEACEAFKVVYQLCKKHWSWDQELFLKSQYLQSCESKEIKEWYKSSSIMLHGGFFSIAVAVLLSVSRNSV